ncbi:MAG: hypothetical protein GY777_23150, partial [Candidatus Brocadiaceae bacterium]|nr:hypothetical protein [Candidatus Brocadiaceae bacterium]
MYYTVYFSEPVTLKGIRVNLGEKTVFYPPNEQWQYKQTVENIATQDWVNENANNYVLPSDVVQDNSYVKTDKNFTDNHFTKLNSIDATALSKVPDTYAPIGNVENNIVYVQNPKGGTFRKSGNSVGMIRIKTPSIAGNAMLTFTVDIFEYSTRKSRTMKISGYAYTGAWANTSVHTVTSA